MCLNIIGTVVEPDSIICRIDKMPLSAKEDCCPCMIGIFVFIILSCSHFRIIAEAQTEFNYSGNSLSSAKGGKRVCKTFAYALSVS